MKKANRKLFAITLMVFALIGFWACSKDNSTEDDTGDLRANKGKKTLTVSSSSLQFQGGESSQDISITTNIDAWTINSNANWITLSQTSGIAGTTTITVTVSQNTGASERSADIVVSANQFKSQTILVTQASGALYPNYNINPIPADATGMSSNAVELAAKMHMGINFGNTMVSPTEGEWNSKITLSYVQFVKQLGFNAVRLPVGWVWGHLSDPEKMEIDPVWLDRVKEVVGWCVDNDMYVILNAHADLGWLENNVNEAEKDLVNAKQKALWEQIATAMRDFDEHLIFAGTNEPAVDNAEQMAILDTYHQTFVDAVRATGGKNSYRVLVVQGPRTNGELTYNLMNTLPVDQVPNRMMVEIHNYTPATFTIVLDGDVEWGTMVYYWGAGNHSTIEPERNATYGEEDEILDEFQKMKQKFVDNGIPVVLGEYASWRRTADLNKPVPLDTEMHNKSVDYWATYVTQQAKAHGLLPFWWEIGFMLDRANNVVKDQAMLDAIFAGYNQ